LKGIRERIGDVPKRTPLTETIAIPAGDLPRNEKARESWVAQQEERIAVLLSAPVSKADRATARELKRALKKLDHSSAHTYQHAPFDARLLEAARKALCVPKGEQGAMSWVVGTKKAAWIQWSTGGVLIMPLWS
jgi:hypothetical protein